MDVFLLWCKDFGQFLQLPDNPHGARKRLTASVPHIPVAGTFSFRTLFSGDIIMHHILVADKQLWRHKNFSLGVFWSPKNAGSFWAKVVVMMHRTLTHFEWTCWCMQAVMVSVAPYLKPVYLGFEVKTFETVVNWPLAKTPPPITA